jgi:hypothetical protein
MSMQKGRPDHSGRPFSIALPRGTCALKQRSDSATSYAPKQRSDNATNYAL